MNLHFEIEQVKMLLLFWSKIFDILYKNVQNFAGFDWLRTLLYYSREFRYYRDFHIIFTISGTNICARAVTLFSVRKSQVDKIHTNGQGTKYSDATFVRSSPIPIFVLLPALCRQIDH